MIIAFGMLEHMHMHMRMYVCVMCHVIRGFRSHDLVTSEVLRSKLVTPVTDVTHTPSPHTPQTTPLLRFGTSVGRNKRLRL